MRFHIFYTAILAAAISIVGCSGSSGSRSTNNANPTPNTNPTTSVYGTFRKLNPTTKSGKSMVAYSDNQTVTMSTARAGHKVIQISSDLFMLIGGEIPEGKNISDKVDYDVPSTIDYFDRATETFTHKSIATNVSRHCYSDGSLSFGILKIPDGNILMVGGADTVKDTVEIYNPTTETITLCTDVFPNETPVNNITDMFYMGNNKILLVGCAYTQMPVYPQTILRGNAVLDLTTMKAEFIQTPMLVYRECAIQVADGSVIIIGGIEQDCNTVHKEISKVDNNFVTTKVADMSTERFAFGACLLSDGKVGIYGGVNFSTTPGCPSYPKSVDVYDPIDNSVTKSVDLPGPRNSLRPVLLQDGFTLNAGGCQEGHLVSTEIVHNHTTGVVGFTGNLTTPRRYFSTIPLNNGRVLISGGDGEANNYASLNTAEIYDPASKVIISCDSSTIAIKGTIQFTANKTCSWTVTNIDPNNKNAGSISESGLFTAPSISTKVKVTATCSEGSGYVIVSVVNE